MSAAARRVKLIGVNHVAIEVGDIDEALAFYGRFFDFALRGREEGMAFIDLGDQFLALIEGRTQPQDDLRHFGLVVDDRTGLRDRLEQAGVPLVCDKRLDFLDPWGNRIEIVPYESIQFLKARAALASLGVGDLRKTDEAKAELHGKGIDPPEDA